MTRKIRIFLGVTALFAAVCLAIVTTRTGAPQYEGKSVDFWVDQIWCGDDGQVQLAFRKMGVTAIPVILSHVRYSPSVYEQVYTMIWGRLPSRLQSRMRTPRPPSYGHKAPVALSMIGPAAVPQLMHACADRDFKVRLAACSALEHLAADADSIFPVFIQLLGDPDHRVRRSAASGLGETRLGRQTAIPQLIRQLDGSPSTSVPVRAAAARSLGRFGADAHEAVPDLRRLVQSDSGPSRRAAALALWRITADPGAIPVLIDELEAAQDAFVCLELLRDLGDVGPAAAAAVPVILDKWEAGRLQSGPLRIDVRQAVRDALSRIDPKSSPEATAVNSTPLEVLQLKKVADPDREPRNDIQMPVRAETIEPAPTAGRLFDQKPELNLGGSR